LTPPPDRDEDTFRRNIRVNKPPQKAAHQPQNPPRNNQANEVRSPQAQSSFVPLNTQNNNQNNKNADLYTQQQVFPPHTAKPVDDHVTEASTQYETYSHHPQIIYAHQRPQYGPQLFRPNPQDQTQQYQQEYYHQPSPSPQQQSYEQPQYYQQIQHPSQIQQPETHYGENSHPQQQQQQQQIIYQQQQTFQHPNDESNFRPNYGY
jgi:hypothetical protein